MTEPLAGPIAVNMLCPLARNQCNTYRLVAGCVERLQKPHGGTRHIAMGRYAVYQPRARALPDNLSSPCHRRVRFDMRREAGARQ